MEEDDLPTEYDTIVLGTGMVECILAAAHSRNGKQVLHIDQNEFYGGLWASFNFDSLNSWLNGHADSQKDHVRLDLTEHLSKDGREIAVPCLYKNPISNVEIRVNVPVEIETENEEVVTTEETKEEEEKTNEKEGAEPKDVETPELEVEKRDESKEKKEEVWSLSKLKSLYRKFNLDLSPKLLFSRGELVELLISSNIARYAEFKSVTRVLTYLDGKLEQVPCSRSDVFSTKNVSIVEKRMLMKLLTFCINYEQHSKEYQGYENKTFVEFLRSRKLTNNIQHYVLHAIAMVSQDATTLEGLKATQRFLNSLGRYGNTPFLWPLYGSGELPQCFCRLCAVFGGIYYLKRGIEAIILNDDNECVAVISNGKRMNCKYLVMDASTVPSRFLTKDHEEEEKIISKAILITDRSLSPSEKEQITFLRLPPSNELPNAVSVIELGPGAMVCPQNLFVVYLTSQSTTENAAKDLNPAIELLFANDSETEPTTKPKVLWAAFFNQTDFSNSDLVTNAPSNVFVTSGPSSTIDFDDAVTQARNIFRRSFPDEEFLPRAPDPEEIVIEDAEEARPEPGFLEDPTRSSSTAETDGEDKVSEAISALEMCSVTEESEPTVTEPQSTCNETNESLEKEE